MSREQLKLTFLKEWGKGRDFGEGQIDLDVCSTIYNQRKFFDSHIRVLEAGAESKNKSLLMPYYQRLLQFYYLVENKKAGN